MLEQQLIGLKFKTILTYGLTHMYYVKRLLAVNAFHLHLTQPRLNKTSGNQLNSTSHYQWFEKVFCCYCSKKVKVPEDV